MTMKCIVLNEVFRSEFEGFILSDSKNLLEICQVGHKSCENSSF